MSTPNATTTRLRDADAPWIARRRRGLGAPLPPRPRRAAGHGHRLGLVRGAVLARLGRRQRPRDRGPDRLALPLRDPHRRRPGARVEDRLDRDEHHVDSTIVRGQKHVAGAQGDPEVEGLGRRQGVFATKLHLRAGNGGKPIAFPPTAGQRHETIAFNDLMARSTVRRPGRGRPRHRPRAIVRGRVHHPRRARMCARIGSARASPPKCNQPCATLCDRGKCQQV
ncbi:uncharacterized protein SOCEGT47_039100 [Sorangium cellulosum]|uniref:Transposase n=1 Tax=Sorangium cellulosum TaxID=56 RepID=A0A4P2Q268_SORCE|nr:uncharacterized protein SOCEGT47_039100 [Sorangium cellulosum]